VGLAVLLKHNTIIVEIATNTINLKYEMSSSITCVTFTNMYKL
jgi:hypothetical protein